MSYYRKPKYCPFCKYGRWEGYSDVEMKTTCDKPPMYYVLCHACGATGPLNSDPADAARGWDDNIDWYHWYKRMKEEKNRTIENLKRQIRFEGWVAKLFGNKQNDD